VHQLGQVTEKIGSGVTPTGGSRVYKNSGRPFMRSQNVGWGHLDLDDVAFIDDEMHATFDATEIRAGDVFLNITGASIGRSAIADQRIAGGNVNQHVCIIRAEQKKLVPGFLCTFLISSRGQRQIDSFQAGGNRQGLNFAQVRAISIAAPRTTEEQRAIATVLSDVDALLGGMDRLIAKKRDLKQAAMQQLLTGQTRLPGFGETWAMSKVGCEFEVKLGKMLNAEENIGLPKPFIGNKAVQWNGIDVSNLATVPLTRADIEAFRLRKDDVLVCEGGEVGRAAIWGAPIEECYFQKALHRLRPLRGFNPRFMVSLLRLWADRSVFSNFVTQTSIAHLPRERFVQMPLPVPEPEEQRAIATVLSDMDAEIEALEARRAKTRDLKQAMMQELLTGRTRLI